MQAIWPFGCAMQLPCLQRALQRGHFQSRSRWRHMALSTMQSDNKHSQGELLREVIAPIISNLEAHVCVGLECWPLEGDVRRAVYARFGHRREAGSDGLEPVLQGRGCAILPKPSTKAWWFRNDCGD